eukprot:g15248.t1
MGRGQHRHRRKELVLDSRYRYGIVTKNKKEENTLASVEDGAGRPLTKLCAHPEVRALAKERAKKDGVQLKALQIVQCRDAVFEVCKDVPHVEPEVRALKDAAKHAGVTLKASQSIQSWKAVFVITVDKDGQHQVALKQPEAPGDYGAFNRLKKADLSPYCPQVATLPLKVPPKKKDGKGDAPMDAAQRLLYEEYAGLYAAAILRVLGHNEGNGEYLTTLGAEVKLVKERARDAGVELIPSRVIEEYPLVFCMEGRDLQPPRHYVKLKTAKSDSARAAVASLHRIPLTDSSSTNAAPRVVHHNWRFDPIIMAREARRVAPYLCWRRGVVEFATAPGDRQRSFGAIRLTDAGGFFDGSVGAASSQCSANRCHFDKTAMRGTFRLPPEAGDAVRLMPRRHPKEVAHTSHQKSVWEKKQARTNPESEPSPGSYCSDLRAAKRVEVLEWKWEAGGDGKTSDRRGSTHFRGLRHLFLELRVFWHWRWLLDALLEEMGVAVTAENDIANKEARGADECKHKAFDIPWLSEESSEDEGRKYWWRSASKPMKKSAAGDEKCRGSDEAASSLLANAEEDAAFDHGDEDNDEFFSSSEDEGDGLNATTDAQGLPLQRERHLTPLQTKRRRAMADAHESFWVLCVREALAHAFPGTENSLPTKETNRLVDWERRAKFFLRVVRVFVAIEEQLSVGPVRVLLSAIQFLIDEHLEPLGSEFLDAASRSAWEARMREESRNGPPILRRVSDFFVYGMVVTTSMASDGRSAGGFHFAQLVAYVACNAAVFSGTIQGAVVPLIEQVRKILLLEGLGRCSSSKNHTFSAQEQRLNLLPKNHADIEASGWSVSDRRNKAALRYGSDREQVHSACSSSWKTGYSRGRRQPPSHLETGSELREILAKKESERLAARTERGVADENDPDCHTLLFRALDQVSTAHADLTDKISHILHQTVSEQNRPTDFVNLRDVPWRELPDRPTVTELRDPSNADAVLPKISFDRPYGSFEEYMETNLRLFREDGISKIRTSMSKYIKDWRILFREMGMYWCDLVGLHVGSSSGGGGPAAGSSDTISLVLRVKQALGKDKEAETIAKLWGKEELRYGNMVYLSLKGTFAESNILFATVTWSALLQQTGLFMLELVAQGDSNFGRRGAPRGEGHPSFLEMLSQLLASDSLVVAEQLTYYPAYGPVMRVLRESFGNARDLAFHQELVFGRFGDKAKRASLENVVGENSIVPSIAPWTEEGGEGGGDHKPHLLQFGGALDGVWWTVEQCCDAILAETQNGDTPNCNFGVAEPPGKDHVWNNDSARCTPSKNVVARPRDDETDTGLDSFQLRAVHHVLTNRLSMIQGAPGTGKSFLGRRIIRILHSMRGINNCNTNPSKWKNPALIAKAKGKQMRTSTTTNDAAASAHRADNFPEEDPEHQQLRFLVVTYKNLALDETLSGLLSSFPTQLVRIGNSTSPADTPALSARRLFNLKKDKKYKLGGKLQEEHKLLRKKLGQVELQLEAEIKRFRSARLFTPTLFFLSATYEQLLDMLLGAWTAWRPYMVEEVKAESDIHAMMGHISDFLSRREQLGFKDDNHDTTRSSTSRKVAAFFANPGRLPLEYQTTCQKVVFLVTEILREWIPPKAEFAQFSRDAQRSRFDLYGAAEFIDWADPRIQEGLRESTKGNTCISKFTNKVTDVLPEGEEQMKENDEDRLRDFRERLREETEHLYGRAKEEKKQQLKMLQDIVFFDSRAEGDVRSLVKTQANALKQQARKRLKDAEEQVRRIRRAKRAEKLRRAGITHEEGGTNLAGDRVDMLDSDVSDVDEDDSSDTENERLTDSEDRSSSDEESGAKSGGAGSVRRQRTRLGPRTKADLASAKRKIAITGGRAGVVEAAPNEAESSPSDDDHEVDAPSADAGHEDHEDRIPYYPAIVDALPAETWQRLLLTPRLYDMQDDKRRCMTFVQLLLHKAVDEVETSLSQVLLEHERLQKERRQLQQERVVRILRSQIIVGATIVGASIHTEVLQRLRPDVVVVEEAAEVLEALLLPCLGPWVKQLIMIGDHQQLPPMVESDILRTDYNFACSAMLRMIREKERNEPRGRPIFAPLRYQARSLPEISKYLRQAYPDLKDNTAATDLLSPVACVEQPILWWDTGRTGDEEYNHSFKNPKEAAFVVAWAFWLFQQGEEPEDVHVLAPYRAQVACIAHYAQTTYALEHRELLRDLQRRRDEKLLSERLSSASGNKPEPEGAAAGSCKTASNDGAEQGPGPKRSRAGDVEAPENSPASGKENAPEDNREKDFMKAFVHNITPIDGFQGNQNKIVIISWTRSNEGHDCGFLKRPEGLNRRIVAQSRGRSALYMVGDVANFEFDVPKKNLLDNAVHTASTTGPASAGVELGVAKRTQDADKKTGNKLWKQPFLDLLRADGRVNDFVSIRCPRHPEHARKSYRPEDFPDPFKTSTSRGGSASANKTRNNSRIGGMVQLSPVLCPEICGKTIPACGHICAQPCHAGPCLQSHCCEVFERKCPRKPAEHKPFRFRCKDLGCGSSAQEAMFFCEEAATTSCARCGKVLKKKCGELASQQTDFFCEIRFKCSRDPKHKIWRQCNEQEADILCKEPCSKSLPCGHKCPLPCWDDCSKAICREIVVRTCAAGLHKQKHYCCNVAESTPAATEGGEMKTSDSSLPCQEVVHFRCRKCGNHLQRFCYQDEAEVRCERFCRKKLPNCPHLCQRRCWEPCAQTPDECPICIDEKKRNFYWPVIDDFDDEEEAAACQKTISDRFRNGKELRATLSELRQDAQLMGAFPNLVVVEHEGFYWSMDNRRLWLLRQLYGLLSDALVEVIFYPCPQNYGAPLFFRKLKREDVAEACEELRKDGHNGVKMTKNAKFAHHFAGKNKVGAWKGEKDKNWRR